MSRPNIHGGHELELVDGSVNEQSLALSWQIPRSAISTIRKARLREHWHWKRGPSGNQGDIRITREGLEELKKWLVPTDKPVLAEAPEKVIEPVTPGTIPFDDPDVVVVHRIPPNPRMLIAHNAQGRSVSIRVRRNDLFRAGMKISLSTQCVRLDSASGPRPDGPYLVYAFSGKYPRGYGRW